MDDFETTTVVSYRAREDDPLLRSPSGSEYATDPTISVGRLRNTSSLMTFANLLKAYIASGFLATPFFYKSAGVIGGCLMIIVLAVLCILSTWYLVQTKIRLERYGVYTYTDVARTAVGPKFAIYVTASLVMAQCGFCVAYSKFVIDNVGEFFPDADKWVKGVIITACYSVVCFLIMTIRTQQVLGIIGMISNVCFYTGVIGIVAMSAYHLRHGDPAQGMRLEVAEGSITSSTDSNTKMFGSAISTILSFGLIVYSYEGVGVVLPAQATIVRQNHFFRIIAAVITICGILFISFGTLNYAAYGPATESEITDNIDAWAHDMKKYRGEPQWLVLSKAIRILLIIAVGGTFGHQIFPVTDLADEALQNNQRAARYSVNTRFYVVRIIIALITTFLAYVVPSFDFILTLVGAVGSTPLQFVVPCVVYYTTFKDELSFATRLGILAFIAFGIIAGCLCFVLAILSEAGIVAKTT